MSKMCLCCPSFSVAIGAKSRMWKRFCLLALLLLVAALPLKAAPVSEGSARTVAANVLGTTQLVNRTAELPSDIGQYMYLFSPESGVGFVLISADDCALPVLGYSTTSTMNFAVAGFSSWLSHSKTQIANIRSQGLAASARVAALWTQLMDGGPVLTGASVVPMLTTAWGVDVRYRRFSPVTSSGYECHPGQIAVAMAQIMKYWNYPPRGQGSVSYTNTGDVAAQVSADFSTAYDWDNMPDVLTDASSDAEKDAVNEIIFHAGAAIQTIYRVNNSPMQGGNIYAAFRNNFRYNTQTVRTINTSSFTHAAYDEMMMAEITSGRPFLYRNGNVYYCFVVDGCDGWGQYHVNWGNAGSNNGYFALGSLNPEVYTYPWSVISVVGIDPLTLYAISVQSNNDEWGSVSGGGSYVVGDRVTLEATPALGYAFSHWSDGGTENPRQFSAMENRNEVAYFVHVGTVNINAETDNAERGSVSGSGTYTIGDNVVLSAMPMLGWMFDHWDDGNTDNPRTIVATESRTYTAFFVRAGEGRPELYMVELDDRENHAWSYYSDPTCLVRSLNPADVKIRYFGYGENTMYSSDALVPTGDPDVDVAPLQVGIGIDAPWKNAYVYHKTLERVNGEQAESMAAADGPCFYSLIPNPYSRRPTHGTGNTRWRGFYKWRLKAVSGGTVFRDMAMTQPVTAGTMLDAEDTVFFLPAAEYGMEVDFEAIWARAFVFNESKSGSGINASLSVGSYATGINAYERNFVILTANGNFTVMPTRPSTVSAVYPDGTNGTNTYILAARPTTVTLQHSMTDNFHADTKFEYLVIRSLNKPGVASQVQGNYVIFGRGLKNADGTPVMRRLCDTWDIRQYNSSHLTKYRLESGDYDTVLLLGYNTRYRNLVYAKATMGSDYDRSLGDNSQLYVFSLYGSHGSRFEDPRTADIESFRYVVKSGSYGMIYMGVGFSWSFNSRWEGTRSLAIEGGSINELAGGKDCDSTQYVDTTKTKCRIRLHEGQYNGPIYGAAAHVQSQGHRRMVATGGRISGWLAGGVNGKLSVAELQTTTFGCLKGNSYIYFGGRAHMQHTAADPMYNHSLGGFIYGAGCGHPNDTGSTTPTGRVNNSTIVIADSAYVSRNVYGGGNYGYIADTGSRIQILGGTVAGKVFGGSNRQRGRQVDIFMCDGQVVGGIHGGSNHSGTIAGPITVRIEGGVVGRSGCADSIGNVFGCGYGIGTSVTGNVNVIIGREDTRTPHINNPLIHGNVYGGGFMGAYNATGRLFRVTTYNGRIVKSVYGGGFGTSATITGNTNVNILGTTYVGGNVYGGGNMGKVTGNTFVVIGDDTSSYTLAVQSANTAWGTVSGGGLYQAGTVASISATPASGYRFKQWNDGNTQNPRTVTVVGNATYTAQFEAIPVRTITVAVADGHSAMGTVSGGGNYREGQAVSISATATPGYRFKQWDDGNTQNPRTITVIHDATYTAEFTEYHANWVDLGLPSGLLWADANLGAESPEQYGDYYAWGETTTKSSYTWNTYKYCRGSMNTLTKYCDISTSGYNGYTDNLTTLQPEDDAATATLGGDARIPTSAEWREMINNTTQTNETLNGVAGRRFTSKTNGNSIFIPFGGHMDGTNLARGGSSAEHWTASYGTFTPSTAEMFFANSSNGSVSNGSRLYGFNIRAVRGGN